MSINKKQLFRASGQDKLSQITGRVRPNLRFGLILPTLVLGLAFLLLPVKSDSYSPNLSSTVPVFKIVGVVRDQSVTIRTSNFPANQVFTATMGPMGTRGINGIVVGTVSSGAGGSFDATFPIPAALYGSYQISIRLQTGGAFPYYAFNWFYNNTTGNTGGIPPVEPPPPSYTGIPTFGITAVVKDTSVSIKTNNFPPNQTFNVTMGPFGTRGINGISVGTIDSGSGGTITGTFAIPAQLMGLSKIAIRAQTAHAYPYYSYNWFWNNDANVPSNGTGGIPPTEPPPAPPPYTGIPVMKITAVKANESVTFQTGNYPPNQTFDVTMGPMGMQGIGGIWVGQFQSGAGGSFSVTMPIPAQLAGTSQIAIRAQTAHAYPYFSYNWFYNNTTP